MVSCYCFGCRVYVVVMSVFGVFGLFCCVCAVFVVFLCVVFVHSVLCLVLLVFPQLMFLLFARAICFDVFGCECLCRVQLAVPLFLLFDISHSVVCYCYCIAFVFAIWRVI